MKVKKANKIHKQIVELLDNAVNNAPDCNDEGLCQLYHEMALHLSKAARKAFHLSVAIEMKNDQSNLSK